MRANETYSEAKHQFSVRNRDVLMNDQSPHKWWFTLKSAVFGSYSAPTLLPLLVGAITSAVVMAAEKKETCIPMDQCQVKGPSLTRDA